MPSSQGPATTIAFVLAFASSLFYGAGDFFGGIASRRARVFAVTLLSQAAGLAALVIAALVVGGTPPASAWPWAIGAGLFGSTGVLLFYRALAIGTVSIVAPVTSAVALCVPVAAGFAWGERPGMLPLVGIALAPAAVALVGSGEGKGGAAQAGRALLLAIASGAIIGGFLVGIGRLPAGGGLWPLAIARGAGTLTIALAALVRRESPRVPAFAWAPILGCALFDVTANVLFRYAAAGAPLSLVATIVSLAPASTVLLAQLVLHERLSRRQQAGVALALAAIVLLAQPS